MSENPSGLNLAGLIIWWFGQRSKRFNQNMLAVVLVVLALVIIVGVFGITSVSDLASL